jgi:hypothetical protein
MPPIQSDSEEEIPKRGRKQVQEEDTPAGSADENEEEEDDDEEVAEDEYIVEKIKDHKFEKNVSSLFFFSCSPCAFGGVLRWWSWVSTCGGRLWCLIAALWVLMANFCVQKLMLLVKWKGYEDPADETWEPEANCRFVTPLKLFLRRRSFALVASEKKWPKKVIHQNWHADSGAQEVVNEYFTSIGGRPKAGGIKRKGVSSTPSTTEQKKKRGRTSVPAEEPSASPSTSRGGKKETKKEEWKPSSLVDWEKEVESIDTIEKNSSGLVCYIHW